MEYIFFGTPEFAAIILRKLIDAGMPPAVVVCNPDRPVGRKKIVTSPPTKILATEFNIPVLQPESLEIGNCPSMRLGILSPSKEKLEIGKIKNGIVFDFFIVAAYAKIIPKEILEIPRLGTIGVHPSLLPKYRGSSPIQTAILSGEEETGVTLYLLDEKADHGQIVSSAKCQVSGEDTYEILLKKLAELGGNLLVETIPKFLAGVITPKTQNESEATYTKKLATDDAFVDENDLNEAVSGKDPKAASIIGRKIRALNPEPGVWTYANGLSEWAHANNLQIQSGMRVKLLGATVENGALKLKKIQEEGGKPKTL